MSFPLPPFMIAVRMFLCICGLHKYRPVRDGSSLWKCVRAECRWWEIL